MSFLRVIFARKASRKKTLTLVSLRASDTVVAGFGKHKKRVTTLLVAHILVMLPACVPTHRTVRQ